MPCLHRLNMSHSRTAPIVIALSQQSFALMGLYFGSVDAMGRCQEAHGNIGKKARRWRAMLGFLSLVSGAFLGTALLLLDVDRWWRLLVFIPVQFGCLGILQAMHSVCAVYAAMGVWQIARASVQKIPDPCLENEFKSLAKRLVLWSCLIAMIVTAVFTCV